MFETETMRARIDAEGGLDFGTGQAIDVCTGMDVRRVIETTARTTSMERHRKGDGPDRLTDKTA
jgi:hypothetical protein